MSLHHATFAAAAAIAASTAAGCHSGPYYAGPSAYCRVSRCGPEVCEPDVCETEACDTAGAEILSHPRTLAKGPTPRFYLSEPLPAAECSHSGLSPGASGVPAASLSARLHDNLVSRKIAEHKEKQAAPPHPRFHPVPVRPVFYPAGDLPPTMLGAFDAPPR